MKKLLLGAALAVAFVACKKSNPESANPENESVESAANDTISFTSIHETNMSHDASADKAQGARSDNSYAFESKSVFFPPVSSIADVAENSPLSPSEKLKTLNLPNNFIKRSFLDNSLGYTSLEGVTRLVGRVFELKKDSKGLEYFEETGRDFKNNDVLVVAKEPANGVLVKKKYN